MNYLLTALVAGAAALPTTLVVLALWVAHARVVDGNSADSVFLSLVFLFVPLIFFVAMFSNLTAVALGHAAGLIAPGSGAWTVIAAAGVLVWCGCAWTQGGFARLIRGLAPVSAVPVALFSLADMAILTGGVLMLPRQAFS